MANVFKYDAAFSNTQYTRVPRSAGGAHGGIGSPDFPTAVESGAIVIALTGSSYAIGAANDVVALGLKSM